jgi:hypothetical protein
MDKLRKLLQKMEHASIVPNLSLKQEEIEAALDQRDDPHFAETWMNAFRQIEAKKGSKQDAEPRIGQLREMAYLQSYERWQSPDLAAYISDDFGLIGDALATNYHNAWVNGLLHAYLSLRFPHGNVEDREGELGDEL